MLNMVDFLTRSFLSTAKKKAVDGKNYGKGNLRADITFHCTGDWYKFVFAVQSKLCVHIYRLRKALVKLQKFQNIITERTSTWLYWQERCNGVFNDFLVLQLTLAPPCFNNRETMRSYPWSDATCKHVIPSSLVIFTRWLSDSLMVLKRMTKTYYILICFKDKNLPTS